MPLHINTAYFAQQSKKFKFSMEMSSNKYVRVHKFKSLQEQTEISGLSDKE